MNYQSILIVDTSYVVFAKYYSALNWFKVSINRNPEVGALFESTVFQNKYADMFENGVSRVRKQFNIPETNVVFARDCNRSAVWRRAHFHNYKEGRTHNGNFNSEAFNYTYNRIIPKWLERSGGCMIGSEGAEADDVIAVIRNHVRETDGIRQIVILSNDNDCIQLVDENTAVVNLLLQDVGIRRGELTPSQYLRSRILSGDRSDNIPSIVPRCGPKTSHRLVTEKDEQELREMYPASNYDRNDLLMNLRNTPEPIKCAILEQYREKMACIS